MNIQNKLEPLRLLRHLMSFFCPVGDSESVSLEIVPWDIPLQLPFDLLVSRGPRRNWETAKPGATFGGRRRSSEARQVRTAGAEQPADIMSKVLSRESGESGEKNVLKKCLN